MITLPALVGANIKRKRRVCEFSQVALSSKIHGITAGDLSKIEAGKINMTLKTAAKIAAALGCHPREFFEEFEQESEK